MGIQTVSIDICQRYIADKTYLLSEEYLKFVTGALRARDLSSLSSLSGRFPVEQSNREVARVTLQVEAFFKKNADLSDDVRCSSTARNSFLQNERRCRITNRRLDHYYRYPERSSGMMALVNRMERYISRVLGDFSPEQGPSFLDRIPDLVKFTAGATATTSRSNSLPHMKMRLNPRCGGRVVPLVRALAKYYGFKHTSPKQQDVNRVEFVPKSWKTHRSIACEPEGNIPFQLAFDS